MMKWRVSIRAAAQDDLRQARGWYEQHRRGLGDDFLLAIAEALESLEESPQRPTVYYRDFRRVLIERFPYKVFYRIDGEHVIVFRILHAARDHVEELKD